MNAGGWHDVGPLDALPDGDMASVDVAGTSVVLIRRGPTVVAYEDRCTHLDFPLSTGVLDGNEIVCSWHGACFLIDSGLPTCPPADGPLRSIPVRLEDGRVWLSVL